MESFEQQQKEKNSKSPFKMHTSHGKMLADLYTPVAVYLRLRDRFRDTILLESADFHSVENSFSFICINAIGGVEVTSLKHVEYKLPGRKVEKEEIRDGNTVLKLLNNFTNQLNFGPSPGPLYSQGLYGYTSYDAIQLFDTLRFNEKKENEMEIPLMRYRLYQYVIAINHFKDELILCENHCEGIESEREVVESLIKIKDAPSYPFKLKGAESSTYSNQEYIDIVKKGISHCHRGNVFQIVLSRRFQQSFQGDEFNVYRALRNINPSPYLFFFDYGDYKLMGSSPESQLLIQNGYATLHPIAGTFRRSGEDDIDKLLAEKLTKDEKENAEHVMLVDLARNDLSRACDEVEVNYFKKVQYYSHVIHLTSEVSGRVKEGISAFELLMKTFPAGTLSGAPKYRAMELIDELEKTKRNYYGGCIGFIGLNGSCVQAIMIRTFLSKGNRLYYQAGAGVVAASDPESELQEVNNKLNALKKALDMAQTI